MEQRWQDLANLLSLPGQGPAGPGPGAVGPAGPGVSAVDQLGAHGHGHGHAHPHAHAHAHAHAMHQQHPSAHLGHPSHPAHTQHYGYEAPTPARSVVLHNATLAPPVGDLNSSSVYPGLSMGNAVAQSMNLTNSSEPMGDVAPPSGFKMEPPHDMLYYQNSTSSSQELGQLGALNSTTEGFLSAILNDEDLQLMDMMNESMYPMRMLESNSSNNASSVSGLSVSTLGIAGAGVGGTGGPSAAGPSPLGPPLGATGPLALGPGATEERLDASSDSAVSSMGSERVASLSDGGEWMETGSDSGHTPNDHYHMDYKYRHAPQPHEYGGYLAGADAPHPHPHRMPPAPVAQKKHQMFGKRYFQGDHAGGGAPVVPHGSPAMPTPMPLKYEYGDTARGMAASGPIPLNGSVASGIGVGSASAFASPLEDEEAKAHEMKYSCSHDYPCHHTARPPMEHVAHNHSYHLPPPPESSGAVQRPVSRDKSRSKEHRRSDDAHLSRDEKRARALNIPLTVDDIINLPMDEFNERLSKHDLSEAQLSLIRDIRRRGKNKVAAQNCRKRKLDQIVTLADEVQQMRSRKQKLLREHDFLTKESARVKEKFSQLYRHVFQSLRDVDGSPYSPYEYSLQQAPEGNVVLVPRATNSASLLEPLHPSMIHAHQMSATPRSSSTHQHPHMQSDHHKEQHPQHPHPQHPHHPHHPHSDPHHKE